jgi:hypothetical protein
MNIKQLSVELGRLAQMPDDMQAKVLEGFDHDKLSALHLILAGDGSNGISYSPISIVNTPFFKALSTPIQQILEEQLIDPASVSGRGENLLARTLLSSLRTCIEIRDNA